MLKVDVSGREGAFRYEYALEVGSGVTAIWGKSGAGKTTLIRAIAGLTKPTTGHIAMADQIWFDAKRGINLPPARRRTGYMPQSAHLFEHLSVRRNLTYANWAGRRTSPIPLEDLIDLLDIAALLDRKPAGLSGGERRRVALGRAIASGPDILLLDEPFAGLDEARIGEIVPYIRGTVNLLKLPTLLVTHSRSEVARLAERGVMVEQGHSTGSMSVQELFLEAGEQIGPNLVVGVVEGYDQTYGLNAVTIADQPLLVPGPPMEVGSKMRILVDPHDVLISSDADLKISARNRLACRVVSLQPRTDIKVQVLLAVGDQTISAEITRQALEELELAPGHDCVAILKSTSLGQQAYTWDG